MEVKPTQEELTEIEKQLSHPDGENGIEMANLMNETNLGMTTEAIKSLSLKNGDKVLELGHGNCRHLSLLMDSAKNMHYTGLEISETMKQEAEKINTNFISTGNADFSLYNGIDTPFVDNSFDKIITVNTIYFWAKPTQLLVEIYRILKPGGRFAIAFAQKDFMENLPFVQSRFNLYDNKDIKELIEKTDLRLIEIIDKTEQVKSKADELVNREFSVAVVEK